MTPEPAPVVVGVDTGDAAAAAVAWAAREAAIRGTGLWVVHAWQEPGEHAAPYAPPRRRTDTCRRTAGWFDALLAACLPAEVIAAHGLTVRRILLRGDPSVVLPGLTKEADLLVLGGRTDREVPVTFGPTIRACLSHALCPVVIVTTAAAEHEATRSPVTTGSGDRS